MEEQILQQRGREGCPGSYRSLGALGPAQRFGAISWLSLGFGVFNLWVLPAGSTGVRGKNTHPLGAPRPEPFLQVLSAAWSREADLGMETKREKNDPKI